MKKIIISLLFLLVFYKLSFAGSISVPSFLTADNVTVAQLETMRSTFQGAINSADGGLLQSQTVTTEKLDTNANPENRWNEAFNDFVYTGLLPISYDTSTSAITTAGIAYIYGVRVVKDATPHTYTADKATYVDLSKNGTFTYSETELGSSAPITAGNSIRLAIVSADDTTITSISDKRVTTVALTTGEAMPATDTLADVDGNTKVQVEENSNEDKIRFDTAGTQRAMIDSDGLILASGASVNEFSTDGTFADNSDDAVPTEKAVKTYFSSTGFANGALATPSIFFTNDIDTGIFYDTTPEIILGVSGNNIESIRASNVFFNLPIRVEADSGSAEISTTSTGSSTTTMYIGNASINVSSDKRLKKNITDTNVDAVDLLDKLRIVDFEWNDPSDQAVNNKNSRGRWTGMIAQEVVDVVPYIVNAPRKEDNSIDYNSESYWFVEYQQLVPVLIKAIQELEARIKILETP